jgi:phosphatidylglycerol:prolipoprotein diacylglycerol transferase
LLVILWLVRTKTRVANGVITGLFFVGYALTRSFAETFRSPDAGYVWLLTKGQFLSVFTLLVGVGFLVAAKLKPSYPPALAKNRHA